MKIVVPSLILALAVFLVVGLLFYGKPSAPGAEISSLRKTVEDRLAALDEELVRVSERLAAVEDDVSSRLSPEATAAHVPSPNETAAAPVAAAGPAAATESPSSRAALADFAKGETDTLRSFVAGVIQQERVERQEKQRLAQQRRMEEYRELQKGPYGKHNYKVNSLAKRLDMTDAQKQSYYNILVDYVSRFRELRKGVNWRDSGARDAYQQSRKALQQEFDAAVTIWLSPEQKEEYSSLSAWERNAEGSAYIFGTGEGMAPVTSYISSPSSSVDLEAAPVVVEMDGAVSTAVGAVSITVGDVGAVEEGGESASRTAKQDPSPGASAPSTVPKKEPVRVQPAGK